MSDSENPRKKKAPPVTEDALKTRDERSANALNAADTKRLRVKRRRLEANLKAAKLRAANKDVQQRRIDTKATFVEFDFKEVSAVIDEASPTDKLAIADTVIPDWLRKVREKLKLSEVDDKPVDTGLSEYRPEALDFLNRLVDMGPNLENSRSRVRSLAYSFIAVGYLMRIGPLAGESLRSISKELGITPEGFRKYTAHWSDVLGVEVPLAKSARARVNMSEAMTVVHLLRQTEKEAA